MSETQIAETQIASRIVYEFEAARLDSLTGKAKDLCNARLAGALEVAALALDAMTPFELELALIDFSRDNPRPDTTTIGVTANVAYRAWRADAMAAVLAVVWSSPIVADAEYLGIKHLAVGDQISFNNKENRPTRAEMRTVTGIELRGNVKALDLDGKYFGTFGSRTKLWQLPSPTKETSTS